jgi:hypothetical protein
MIKIEIKFRETWFLQLDKMLEEKCPFLFSNLRNAHKIWTWNILNITFNSSPAMAPILAPLFGVFFLGGHISLKNRSYRPLLIERACPFKNM